MDVKHARSHVCHCIDYIVTRQVDHYRCRDVQVVRFAMCECDHRFLAMRFRIRRVVVFRRQVRRGHNRYDVSRLSSVVSITGDNRRTGKDKYQQKLAGLLDTSSEDACEEQWNVLRSALTETAAEVLG